MKYTCQVLIDRKIDAVLDAFVKNMIMNKEFKVGSICSFTIDIDENNKMNMTEKIESINLPNEIVTIYEVDKVWNQCINQFEIIYDKVLYRMFVEFRFEDESKIDKDSFYNKTQKQMEEFKNIVEKNY